jgi:hypothetical protein
MLNTLTGIKQIINLTFFFVAQARALFDPSLPLMSANKLVYEIPPNWDTFQTALYGF